MRTQGHPRSWLAGGALALSLAIGAAPVHAGTPSDAATSTLGHTPTLEQRAPDARAVATPTTEPASPNKAKKPGLPSPEGRADPGKPKADARKKGAPPASARSATAAQRARDAKLAKGQILMHTRKIKGFGVPRIITELVIDAPPARVWARVRDCRNLKAIVPALAKIQVQRDTATAQRCWMEVETPFPFSDLESVLDYKRVATPQRYRLSFHMRSGDYVRNRGVWTITAFDAAGQRSRVRYALHTVPKTRAPDSAITWGTKRNVRHMVSALQRTLR